MVDRLTEVLVTQLLQHAIEHRLVNGGVMAGLADAQLAKALSAPHAEPAQAWSLASMAELAGMSRERFAARFKRTVGVTPGDHATGWRSSLARTLMRKGLPVEQVAADAGYTRPGTFGRAFLQCVGATSTHWQSGKTAEV